MFDMNIPEQIFTEGESVQDRINQFSQWRRGKKSTRRGRKLEVYCRRYVCVCVLYVRGKKKQECCSESVCVRGREAQRVAVDMYAYSLCVCLCGQAEHPLKCL